MKIERHCTFIHYFKNFEFYPLILATFPILSLYSHNINHVHYSSILRSVIINIIITLVSTILLSLIIKKKQNAALLVSTAIFLFYSYGHIFNYIEAMWSSFQHRHLTIAWLILFLISIILIPKAKKLSPISKFLTVFSTALIILPIFQIIQFEYGKFTANKKSQQISLDLQSNLTNNQLPDIYYIILDGHTRSDVLSKFYDLDNSEFIEELDKLGFYVGDCSQSNYWRTNFSLSSTLNMDYVQSLFPDKEVLPDWQYSAVIQQLNILGYSMIAFESRGTDLNNQVLGADVLIETKNISNRYEKLYVFNAINDFELELINTTFMHSWLTFLSNFLKYFPDDLVLNVDDPITNKYITQYRDIQFMLNGTKNIPLMKGPKFVFIHLLTPHEPYIFSESGQFEYHDGYSEYKIGYRKNTTFIDSQIPDLVKAIIDRSETPPIIIVQGDHGRNGDPPESAVSILNAYYLPHGGDQNLYPSISPVNTFRVIFNHYFNSSYPLLEDFSYYSANDTFENVEMVPNNCNTNLKQ